MPSALIGFRIPALHERAGDVARLAHRFEVSTGVDNVPALALYAKMGYRRKGDEWKRGVQVIDLAS